MKFTKEEQLLINILRDQVKALDIAIKRVVKSAAQREGVDTLKGNVTYNLDTMTFEYEEAKDVKEVTTETKE